MSSGLDMHASVEKLQLH